jgi:hypothetical protein
VSRSVDHDGLTLLLIGCPDGDDVKPAISKKKRCATREALGGSRIQHFDFYSRVWRGLRVVGRFGDGGRLLCADAFVSLPSIVPSAADDGRKKNPTPDFHRKLFQSATVSGKM